MIDHSAKTSTHAFELQTVVDAIRTHAAVRPNQPAIVVQGSSPVSYGTLHQQIEKIGAGLRRVGVDRSTRVGIVLPDGPALAVAITGVACHSTAVPLNPDLTEAELEEQFAALRVNVVVLPDWMETAARGVAKKRGALLLEAARTSSGVFTLNATTHGTRVPAVDSKAGAEDIAFILRTSGTTARPKLVPVSHRNLAAMAVRLRHWFELSPSDRCLCVMPLYYAQGLKTALFMPLLMGGSLACPARSSGGDFFTWLEELAPTWYSAGPTFHRSVLERALSRQGPKAQHSLRFIQSASAYLPDTVQTGLEELFGVPVLESYGLSEAGLVAANSTRPAGRKLGTAGIPWRGELGIAGEHGELLSPGEVGEIVIQGSGVMPGYIDDPEANHEAFVDGWFRTGDLGSIDAEGFLRLLGRTKEIINRGGEKISPAEIDQALLGHPAVAEAAVFPVPHPRLGEDVAAAVILRPGINATGKEVRSFLRTVLTPFKIPRRIHIVANLPKGETGKVQRARLTQIFAAAQGARPALGPCSTLEIELTEIWRRLLGCETIGVNDDFFEMGGDSLLAMQLLLEVERLTGRSLAASIMFDAATIRQLGESILQPGLPEASLLVQLQAGTGLSPFIYLDGDFSGGGYYARELARLLGPEQPFYVLRPRGLHGGRVPTIEQMARDYMPALALAQLRGPYRLGGHCNGALIALELAHQLTVAGDRVELVAMIDPISLNARPPLRLVNRVLASILYLFDGASERRQMHLGAVMSRVWTAIRTIDEILHEADSSSALAARIRGLSVKMEGFDEEARRRNIGLLKGYYRAMASFIPPRVDARIVCLLTEPHRRSTTFNAKSWRHIAHELEVAVVPGDHLSCVTTHVGVLAHQLRACLSRLDASNAVTDRPYTSARIEGEGNVVMDETRFRDDPGEIVG